MIVAMSCLCSGSGTLIRNFLQSAGYPDWLTIPIAQGKEASLRVLHNLPNAPEKEMLKNLLQRSSKWAVIIGWDNNAMRWSDIAHDGVRSRIEAEFLVKEFS